MVRAKTTMGAWYNLVQFYPTQLSPVLYVGCAFTGDAETWGSGNNNWLISIGDGQPSHTQQYNIYNTPFVITAGVIATFVNAWGHEPTGFGANWIPNMNVAAYTEISGSPSPYTSVQIIITDVNTSAPLAGTITINGTAYTTDANGSVLIDATIGQSYTYYATATGYLASGQYSTGAITGAYSTTLDMHPDTSSPPVDPSTEPTGTFDPVTMCILTFHVVNSAQTNLDISGATVTCGGFTRTTDDSGIATFTKWKFYSYTYYVTKPGYITTDTETSAVLMVDSTIAVLLTQSGSNVPVCDFVGTPLSGKPPLTVQFTDKSSNVPTSWLWSFGDTGTSTSANPSHTYSNSGLYTVSLTASNAYGAGTIKTRTSYVQVRVTDGGAVVGKRVVVLEDSYGKLFCVPASTIQ